MIRVTKLADYGVLLMSWFARAETRHARLKTTDPMPAVSATDIARHTGLPGPTVSKLLRQLAKGGVLESTRGVHGGYRLARASREISVAEVLEAIEGPIALTECLEEGPDCSIEAICPTRANWERINSALRTALLDIRLDEMAHEELALGAEILHGDVGNPAAGTAAGQASPMAQDPS
jgi:FeS assembly SUF system regulator